MFRETVRKYSSVRDRLMISFHWLPALLTRVTVGWIFVQSGMGKLNNLEGVTDFFRSLQIPLPELMAPFVAGTELVCGLLIFIGLLTRLASLPLLGTMIVAILTAKLSEIESFGDLAGMSEFLYIILLVWLLLFGGGKFSIEWFWKRDHALR